MQIHSTAELHLSSAAPVIGPGMLLLLTTVLPADVLFEQAVGVKRL